MDEEGDWTSDTRLVRAFVPDPADDSILRKGTWPVTVPAARQLLREGIELRPGITVLVGENGSGKSTVVEILAEAYGLSPQGGSVLAPGNRLRDSEPGAGHRLLVERGVGGRSAWAYFLRADTMHSLYTYLEQNPGRSRERFHELSHGQGFLEILRTRASSRGFYLMDEPDAPLSFVASLGLLSLLHQLAAQGSQAIVATHSPVIAATPGAHILELGEWGIRPASWDDLELVHSWRGFLSDPHSTFATCSSQRGAMSEDREAARHARQGAAGHPRGHLAVQMTTVTSSAYLIASRMMCEVTIEPGLPAR